MICLTALAGLLCSALLYAGAGDGRGNAEGNKRWRERGSRDGRSAELRTTFNALCPVEDGLLEGCEGVSVGMIVQAPSACGLTSLLLYRDAVLHSLWVRRRSLRRERDKGNTCPVSGAAAGRESGVRHDLQP